MPTYDQATIVDLLRFWAAEDRPHSGVIFADENTVKPNLPADVASAVAALARQIGNADTTNLIRYLRPARPVVHPKNGLKKRGFSGKVAP